MTRIEITLIILFGLIVGIAYGFLTTPNYRLKEVLENRTITPTLLEVKPVTNYEDKLQQSADNRAVRLQVTGGGYGR